MGLSSDGCIRWGGDRQRGRRGFGVNVGCPIVINGNSVTQSCESDVLFPN